MKKKTRKHIKKRKPKVKATIEVLDEFTSTRTMFDELHLDKVKDMAKKEPVMIVALHKSVWQRITDWFAE